MERRATRAALIVPPILAIAIAGVALLLNLFGPSEPRARILPLEISSPFSGKPTALDADKTGRFFVTASSSRTATVWFRETEDSWRPTVYRAPLRDDFEPAKYQAALAPNAEFVALSAPPLADDGGGYKRASARIYVFDRARRDIVATLEAEIPTYVTRLRFSPDGRFLAALLSGGCGLRIWSVSQWRESGDNLVPIFKDDEGYAASNSGSSCCPEERMRSCEARSRGTDLVFSEDTAGQPWLFALSTAGLKIYSRPRPESRNRLVLSGENPIFIPGEQIGLVQPGRLALSSDLSRVAIGDVAAPQVRILEKNGYGYDIGKMVSVEDRLNPDHVSVYFPNVVWVSSGGKPSLAAYGFLPSNALKGRDAHDETNNIAIFDQDIGLVDLQNMTGETDTFLYVSELIDTDGSAKELYVSTERIALIDTATSAARHPKVIAKNGAISFRGFDETYRLILDEKNNVYLSTVLEGKYRLFSILFEKLHLDETVPLDHESQMEERVRTLVATTDHQDRYSLSETKSSRDKWGYDSRVGDNPPTFFDRPVSLDNINPNEVSLSAIEVPPLPSADEPKMVVWGTDRAIRVLSAERGTVCTRPVRAEAQRMNITIDGQFLVVAHGDGIIRWYALGSSPANCLPLVMSLYFTRNSDGEWGFLAWLPDGRYAIDGAVGSQRLACYPVELSGRAPECVDFQQDPSLYDPNAVRNALRDAPRLRGPNRAAENGRFDSQYAAAATVQGIELVSAAHAQTALGGRLANIERAEGALLRPNAQSTILRRAERRQTTIDVVPSLNVAAERFSATVTVSGWGDSKPRYLKFKLNEIDVPVIYNGSRFANGRALPVDPAAAMQLDLEIPKAFQRAGQIKICEFLYRAINRDGTPDESTSDDLSNASPCFSVKWSGRNVTDAPRIKRKLWALIMGFSKSDANPLQYAHEDALDFARLLAMDFGKKLQPTVGGFSAYDDIKIELFYVPPGDYDAKAILNNPKATVLLDDLKDGRLDLAIMGPQDHQYSAKASSMIATMLEAMAAEKAGRSEVWEDDVLIFFAGHGAKKNGLIELETSDAHGSGLIFDNVITQLSDPTHGIARRIFIIDACRPSSNEAARDDMEINNMGVKAYQSFLVYRAKWDFLFSTDQGGYSYEESLFDLDDIVPGFSLWSSKAISKTGNGVFTLAFLSSLVCGEVVNYPAETVYNVDVSRRYLKFFFSDDNEKWRALEVYLKKKFQNSGIEFAAPKPQWIPGGGGDPSESFAFRSMDARPKRCLQLSQ